MSEYSDYTDVKNPPPKAPPASKTEDWPGRDCDHERLRLLDEIPEPFHELLFASWTGESPEADQRLHCLMCREGDGGQCAYPDCPLNELTYSGDIL